MKYFLICARGGSKGLKQKNLKKLKGKTLVERAINFAKKFNKNEIFLSSENKKILKIGISKKINVIERPKELAKDNSNELDVWRNFVLNLKKKNILPNFFINLPPTSPLRTSETVNKAIKKFKNNKFDVVVVVTKSKKNPYYNVLKKKKNLVKVFLNKKIFIRRQQVPKTYDLTTIAYIVKTSFILNKKIKNIFQGKVGFVETKKAFEAIDIDDIYDFKTAELFLKD